MTSPLGRLLHRRIAATGPITVADYMAEALGHPEYGYYATRDPLGAAGDFITAPEISQMFGELIGLWCTEIWRQGLAPAPVNLVELGPGRGTLMADALRAAATVPGYREALSVHLVETSPVLTDIQRRTLAGQSAQWHSRFDDVPAGPILLIANEFFDALPIHQFERTDTGWRERMVGSAGEDGGFQLGLAPGASPQAALIPDSVTGAATPGDIAEICPAGIAIAAAIAGRIARDGGGALFIDYGHEQSAPGDTLQAVRGHDRHDPFDSPGEADLTAHVDFAILSRAAAEAAVTVHGPITQGELLVRLGINLRADRLIRSATEAQAEDIRGARRRLIAPEEMGTLFKAMALTPRDTPPPPGFDNLPEGDTNR